MSTRVAPWAVVCRLTAISLLGLALGCSRSKRRDESPKLAEVPALLDVTLGNRLQQTFSAVDFDGAKLDVELLPFPLPRNSSYNQSTGTLLFTPDEQQVGLYDFVARAVGKKSTAQRPFQVVVGRRTGPTEISGVVLDSDTEAPLVGALIRILDTQLSTVTDSQGRFRLPGIAADARVIEIDGAPAGGWTYVAEDIEMLLGHKMFVEQDNVVFRPIYLPKLGPVAGTIDPSRISTLQNAQAGVALSVPANSARRGGQPFAGDMFMPEVRPDRTPAALPDETQPGLVVAIQPAGLTFNPPAQITWPNRENLEVGTQVDIWSIDPVSGLFADVGDGAVQADGTIRTVRGGVINSSWHFLLPGPGEGTGDTDDSDGENDDQDKQCSVAGSSVVRLRSGNLAEKHVFAPYQSLGVERTLELVYNLKSADPRPVLNNDIFIPNGTAVPEAFSTRMVIGGVEQNFDLFVRGSRDRTRIACQVDATRWATGWYPHEVRLTSLYANSTRTARFFGGTLVTNERSSACGAGWSIAGISRIHPVPDRPFVALAEGDGSIKAFTPQAAGVVNARTDLCFSIDGSGSINAAQWQLQVNGMAAAIEDPNVIPRNGTVRVTLVQYAGIAAFEELALTAIDDTTVAGVAAQIRATRQRSGGTPMAQGIDQAVTSLGAAPREVRQVICLTTDGAPNDPRAAVASADRAVALGIEEIDVIGIGQGVNLQAVRDVVRNGVLVVVPSFAEFASTVGDKIRRVISGSPGGEFSTLRREVDGTYTRTFPDLTLHRFTAAGLLSSVADRNGNTTVYEYDGENRITVIRDPVGLETRFAYNAGGMLASVRRPGDLVTTFQHDGARLARITDPEGRTRTFEYDADFRLTAQVDVRGQRTTYAFDSVSRRLASATHVATGMTRTFRPSQTRALLENPRATSRVRPGAPFAADGIVSEYLDGRGKLRRVRSDRLGRVLSETDALGRTTAFVRNRNGLAERVTHPNGRVDTFLFDERGNVLQRVEASNSTTLRRVWSYTYSRDFGFVTSATDPENRVTRWEYDARGNLTRITRPAPSSATRTFTYTSSGLLSSATDENGRTTRYAYDAQQRLQSITDPLGVVTSYVRDDRGNVVAVTEGDGTPVARTRRFTYDAENRVLAAVDGAGATTRFEYDAQGNLTRTVLPTGEVVQRDYDTMGRLARLIDPLRGAVEFGHDEEGNLRSRRDALGRVVAYEYDDAGQLVKVVDAAGGEEVYTYDNGGSIATMRDARGNVTRLAHDLFQRRTTMTSPEGRVRTWTYDTRDLLLTEGHPGNVVVRYEYDELQRLRTIRVPAVSSSGVSVPANVITQTWDNVGNLLSVADSDTRVELAYDALSRLTAQRTVAPGVQPVVNLDATYDAVGNRTALVDSLGGQHLFGYDAVGRLLAVRTPTNAQIAMSRDPAGRLTTIGFPNGVTASHTYAPGTGRLVDIRHRGPGSAVVLGIAQGFDAVGNITSMQEAGGVRTLGYDNLDRLTTVAAPALPEAYAYDPVGNRLTSHRSTDHTHNRDNQLLQDQQFTYAYDTRGNLVTRTPRAGGVATTFVWDGQNQLVEVRVGGGPTVRYRYDGLGRRVERDVGTGATTVQRYVYDGEHVGLVFTGTAVERLTYGDQTDHILASTLGGDALYYHGDHLGSVRAITRADGSEEVAYEYEAYGEARVVRGNAATRNRVTFTGREWDPDTGLLYYRARWYDPRAGRFVSEDPILDRSGDASYYSYVGGNPVSFVDPTGEFFFVPALIGGGVSALADLGVQLLLNGGRLKCVSWTQVGLAGAAGAVGGAWGAGAFRHSVNGKRWLDASHQWNSVRQRYGRAQNLARGQDVHHWFFPQSSWVGRNLPGIANHPWNLNPTIPNAINRGRFNQLGAVQRTLEGSPGWARAAAGYGAAGAAGDAATDDCSCDK